jgi:O-antigen ligase
MRFLLNLTNGLDRLGRWSAIALGFSIPISVAIDNLLLALVALCFAAGARYREKLSFILGRPALLAPLVLFALLAIGTSYGAAGRDEARQFLLKYDDLALVPVMATFFRDARTRLAGLYGFAGAIVLTLLLSFGIYGGLMSRSVLLLQDITYAVAFKHSLTHSILMAFGAFMFVQLALARGPGPARWIWLVLAAAAVANMTFVVPGRTGFVILGALVLYTGFALWRWTGLAGMAAAFVLVLLVGYHASDRFHDRILRGVAEYTAQRADRPADAESAVGLRMEFYENSLAIVREHPLVGAGTGSFPSAYAEQVKGSRMTPTSNPHNEYLLIAVQLGLVGVLAMLGMFWVLWRTAARLASPLETRLAHGLVLTIGIGCLFNSLLLDHTEGLLYAWLTALLYAGLQSAESRESAPTA